MRLTHSEKPQYTQSPFKKNKKKMTCPVCGNSHRFHCSITQDGSLALCKHKCSDKQAKDGRYIHILITTDNRAAYTAPTLPMREKEVERADVETCHAVYTALLSHLKLSLAHGDLLLNERGLSETTITNNLYASVPDGTKGNRLARAMARFFDLKGVPGFYFKDGRWQLNTSCKGFYVPYRDEHGRIHGLQIRRDSNVEPKYLWLSSRDLPEGTPASVCVHFTKPDLALRDGEVLITEGALKADRISEFCQISCVAVAGVTATSPDMLSALLKRAFPELQDVIIAFDMDWQEKKEVKEALLRLLHRLRDDGMTVKVRTWDLSLGKGLDDALYQTERRAA